MNWIQDVQKFPFNCKARIRYNSPGSEAELTKKNNKIYCYFKEPQLAITPGQSIVFYINESVIGGAIIEK